jgi:hypothetical protein
MNPRDYRDVSAAFQANLAALFDMHPDAFDVLLYLPIAGSAEVVADGSIEDVVGAFDTGERSLEYSDPVECRAIIIPADNAYSVLNDGTGDAGDGGDSPVVMLLSVPNVPKHAVVQYESYQTPTDIIVVNLYVHSLDPVGESPMAGSKYNCIPFRDSL